MKKFISIILSVCMLAALSVGTLVFAEGETDENPEAASGDQIITVVRTDDFTENPTQAILIGDTHNEALGGTYYSWQVNTAAPFKGLSFPQWTPGEGLGHITFNLSVIKWTGDFDDTIATEAVAKTTLTTPGNGVMTWNFEQEVPAGEYLIYLEFVEYTGDYTGHADMHMKTGYNLFDEDSDFYIYTETDAAGYALERIAVLDIIVGPDVDTNPENFFLELDVGDYGDEDEDEDEDEEPAEETEAPATEAPATEAPATKAPAVQTKAPAADDDSEGGDSLTVILIAVGVAVVAIAAVVVVVLKKKK